MTTDFIKSIIVDFWGTVAEMSPYLLFGFFAAGLLSVVISQRLVEKHLGGTGLWPLVKASLFGVPLPLCSCSVIPVSMSLHKHGAAKGPTLSFLLSTPQTGVDSILVTLSLLGPLFAVFRPVAAFVTGIIGGGLVNLFDPTNATLQEKSGPENCPHCRSDNKILTGLKYGFVTLPRDIGKAMLLGLLVAAVISALVPEGYFAEKLGTGIVPMLVMMAL
ncbi:MAG TPA: permease, partial [Sedimentisphaerales bacterium]|nr:permease [Sedimentisphaerales bacterium]